MGLAGRGGVTTLAALIGLAACAQPGARGEKSGAEWKAPGSEAIHALLADRMRHNGVGIVVGVIDRNGRRIVAHGRISASDPRVPDEETVFQLGSLTKLFTTLLLAEMVQRGEVCLDDLISRYLPAEVRMPERGRPVTLRDLATHMSGLPAMPTNYDLAGEPDPYEAYSSDQLHQFLSTYTADRAPGAQWAYSNLGVALLGRLLAGRAGMTYEALLTERMLRPLGMRSTSITLSKDQLKRLAPGHDRYLQPVRTWEMASLPALGSLRSTAGDMLNLLAGYLGYEDTPLKAAMNFQLGERVEQDGGAQALGWIVMPDGVIRHSGGKQGYRSGLAFNPSTGIGAVVLANARTDDAPNDLAVYLVSGTALPPAPRAPAPRARLNPPAAVLEGYAGRYELEDGGMLEIARKEHHLLVHTPGDGISEFFPTGVGDFFMNTGNDQITFQVGRDGKATGLVLYRDGENQGPGTAARRVEK